ncbi:hypothetical protein E4T44_00029 [Aureobasidium sp. EXF-8845]|nr:hypothetical protein E4T44_00029 [Aureobasidium sp. EXF-8845]KAI4858431.1 hypothetical protein E4T45_00046 [Aureobasidium sp. EXF-8846]
MTETQNAQQDGDGPPYPTFNERKFQDNKRPYFSAAYERLIWPVRGEFPSAISVMTEPCRNIGTPQPLFNPETGEWHEIASQSITDTKVSYLEASIVNLDFWDRNWERFHMEHADPAYDECEFVTYGDLDNDNPSGRMACGVGMSSQTQRYLFTAAMLGKQGLTLEVRPLPGNDFVTVKDYVGAVHPWLMSMQDDILAAMRVSEPVYTNIEWRLSNSRFDGPRLKVISPEDWELMNQPIQLIWTSAVMPDGTIAQAMVSSVMLDGTIVQG